MQKTDKVTINMQSDAFFENNRQSEFYPKLKCKIPQQPSYIDIYRLRILLKIMNHEKS